MHKANFYRKKRNEKLKSLTVKRFQHTTISNL